MEPGYSYDLSEFDNRIEAADGTNAIILFKTLPALPGTTS
jgi:hypothetical protein